MHLTKVTIPNARLITHAIFMEQESQLVLGGIDGVRCFRVQLVSRHEPDQNLILNPRGEGMSVFLHEDVIFPDRDVTWVKGMRLQSSGKGDRAKDNLISVWNMTQCNFYSYTSLD